MSSLTSFSNSSPTMIILSLGVLVLLWISYHQFARKQLPLPPGPTGRYPLLGMTFDMPRKKPWIQLAKWAEIYGPIMHIRVGLKHYIYLSSGELSREFLDKRSQIYSSRPRSIVGGIISKNMRSILMPYNNQWRSVRKTFSTLLTAKKCDEYTKIQEKESIASLHDLATHPEDYAMHVHRFALSVARTISYGRRVPGFDEPFAKEIKTVMGNFNKNMAPGKYIVESIPWLRYLPEPLQFWMKELKPVRDYESQINLQNYQQALADVEKHPERKSVARDFTKTAKELVGEMSEEQAAASCTEILQVGSETIATAMEIMIQACVVYPEIVMKAHKELDHVIGRNRMPTWNDQHSLPYIRAIVKECQRWRPIGPLGFPHCSTSDDTYAGYRIPKNSTVIVNIWAIQMDSDRFPEPNLFKPERFLNHDQSSAAYSHSANVNERDHFAFGSGKRICPGIHLAERALFCMTSRLLHIFDVKPGLDEDGNEVPVDVDAYTTGVVSAPEKFPARFEFRNQDAKNLLDREWKTLFDGQEIESWDL